MDAETGKASAVVDEQSKTFIDYSGKKFDRYLDATDEIIWMSERDGWNHLYLYDAKTGRVKNQITKGEWVVRGVDRVDEKKRQIWFRAGGVYPRSGPVLRPLLPRQLRRHGADLVSPKATARTRSSIRRIAEFLIDTYSRVDLPPVIELRRGRRQAGLRTGAGRHRPIAGDRLEAARAVRRQGPRRQDGHLRRDLSSDEPRPQEEVSRHRGHLRRAARLLRAEGFSPFYSQQSLAELGFIVVQIDGMGTSNRSKAFHDVCWKNLGDAGLPDRILWIKAAAERVPVHGPLARRHLRRRRRAARTRCGRCWRIRISTRSACRRLRLPRQPHGQDLVERAVDGLAGRPALRGAVQRRPTRASCAASCS